MKLLLDTHALLWWWTAPEKIPPAAQALLADPETEILVSAISAYELAYKHQLGKLALPGELLAEFEAAVLAERWTPLPVTLAHGLAAGQLSTPHRDPFDRLLGAQAIAEKAALVTADIAFESFAGLQVLW